ncbi:MAG: hypothetical protein WAP23_03160 [Candidatus Spechtbacterales bacterium]
MTTQVEKSVKEAAQDVRDFLTRSNRERKENSQRLMQAIQTRRKERSKNTRDFLAGSAARRTAVFKEVMEGIGAEGFEVAPKKRGRKRKKE